MAEKSEVHNDFLQNFYHGSSVDNILKDLERLEQVEKAGEISARDRYDLQLYAFQTLKNLTLEDPDTAKNLVVYHLLPHCLVTHPEASFLLSRHRGLLSDWINQYPEGVRNDLRNEILEKLYPHLDSPSSQAIFWTISRIGYRNERIIDALWKAISQNDNEIGDTAIATLLDLGIPFIQHEDILPELNKRIAKRYNRSLVSALIGLAAPATIELIHDYWLSIDSQVFEWIDVSLVFSTISFILDARSDDAALQDKAWRLLTNLGNNQPEQFSSEFYFGHTVRNCNSPMVVPTMFDWLPKEPKSSDDPAWGRYLISLRLEESVRPRQLEGWKKIKNRAAIDQLYEDACQDTGQDVHAQTQEMLVKEKAWETLFRTAYIDALNWLEKAILHESGRFLQADIIKQFACLRIESIPQFVREWITERHEPVKPEDGREHARSMAATQLARSAASREAFDMLLDFGFTVEGKALLQSVDALTEVAVYLVSRGDTLLVDDLMSAVLNRTDEHQRIAAAVALERVAERENTLLYKHIEALIPLLYDERREPYERNPLITILGYLKDWQIPAELLQDLIDWAREPDRWIGGAALDVLVRHGYLHNLDNLLEEALGLQKIGDNWDLALNENRFDWAPHFIGFLYSHYPKTFLPAIVSLINDSEWRSAVQPIRWLLSSHGQPHQPPVPDEIKAALIQRIYQRQSGFYSETDIFRVLAALAPEKLAEEPWDYVWSDWLPDSRVALANALGVAALNLVIKTKAVSLLRLLASDGQYQVRRAAYRGLARQSMQDLYALCLSWSAKLPSAQSNQQATTDLRQRAAEASGWLIGVNNEDGLDAFEQLYENSITDSEKTVREAAKRSWEERRKRAWAEDYLSVVRQVKGHTNQEILDAWCYGDALTRVGDDSCVETLRDHLRSESHPPHVRYWIQRIVKTMEENWRKVIQKWPDPWLAWGGTIEEGQGELKINQRIQSGIKYSIWFQPASIPSEKHSWGGAVWLTQIILHTGDGTIELEDGRRGKIVVSRISGNIAVFVGTGPYPT